MLKDTSKTELLEAVRAKYPAGVVRDLTKQQFLTRDFVDKIVKSTSAAYSRDGLSVQLSLESDPKQALTSNDVRGLIIFDGIRTHISQMDIVPLLVRVGGTPLYLGHDGAAEFLVEAILSEVANATEVERSD